MFPKTNNHRRNPWKTGALLMRLLLSAATCCSLSGPADADELTLSGAVKEALAGNPQIAEAAAYRQAAGYGEKAAFADFFPKLYGAYGFRNLSEEPFVNLGGHKAVINSTHQHHWEVGLTQPLFTGFAVSAQHRLAALGLETYELKLRQAKISVAREVKRAYFSLLLAEKNFAVAQTAEKNLIAHEEDARRFHDQGLIPRNDLLKAGVAKADTTRQRIQAAAGVRTARSLFNVLLGREYGAATTVADVNTVHQPEPDRNSLMEEALGKRPELDILSRAMAAGEQEIRLAQSDYYPRVEAVGKYEQDGEDFGARQNRFNNEYNASFGIQARWNFFEAGKTRAKSAKARWEREALEKALEKMRDEVRLQVQEACLDLEVATENIAVTGKALEQAREHWRITNTRYLQQLTTSTEVLDARTYLTRAETGHYEALYGYGMALADLDFAAGRIGCGESE
ncbi:MAG: TolC family protein [Thermodesulfobacteriota bacterium]